MLTQVETFPKQLEDYRSIIGNENADEICRLAESLSGARVLHVNATAFGGGVAELLYSLVPLMNSAGLNAEWQIIHGDGQFYDVTKQLHNSLQGAQVDWTPEMWQIWRDYNLMNAERFEGDYDFVVVHDPQPAGLLSYLRENGHRNGSTRWVWRCHIDSTDAQPEAWNFISPYLEPYDAAIFTLKQFINKEIKNSDIWVTPPAIDPLSPKNSPISQETVNEVMARFNIDPERPLIIQASRMDVWKDPIGVLEAYFQIKQRIPSLQIAFLVAIANDDPEGWGYYNQTVERAGGDPDVHILPNIVHGIGDVEINAFQRGARVVIQKSLREGFGLAVTEALWKGRPVVGGRAGGIPLQVLDGETGYLVSSPNECADRTAYLLENPETSDRLGEQGREHARQNFLITRYLRDYLKVFQSLEQNTAKSYAGVDSEAVCASNGTGESQATVPAPSLGASKAEGAE